MMIKKKTRWIVPGIVLAALGISGCGSGTEPFSLLGDPSQLPTLSMPVTPVGVIGAYTSSTQGFTITAANGSSVSAPAAGVVTAVDTTGTPATVAVTILHTAHLSSRISLMQSSSKRVGDYVASGDAIGTFSTSNSSYILMSVYLDSTATCPLSYFSSTVRTQYLSAVLCSY